MSGNRRPAPERRETTTDRAARWVSRFLLFVIAVAALVFAASVLMARSPAMPGLSPLCLPPSTSPLSGPVIPSEGWSAFATMTFAAIGRGFVSTLTTDRPEETA